MSARDGEDRSRALEMQAARITVHSTMSLHMVRVSSLVMLAGVGLLFVPIPPIATILGIVTILVGVALRVFTDN
jgi:hypothetical protein